MHTAKTHETLMPKKQMKLDARLATVAALIQSAKHADIGSDHGKLLHFLLSNRQIEFGIAIEKHQNPFQNSVDALTTYLNRQPVQAEVRLGDGLSMLSVGEVDSLSICGLGGQAIARILNANAKRVPERVVIQPNNRPEMIRSWALHGGFRLMSETIVGDQREFIVLAFQRTQESKTSENTTQSLSDAAYHGVDVEAGILFGPLLIKRNDPNLAFQLADELSYWSQFSQLKPPAARRLRWIKTLLDQNGTKAI